MTGFGLLGLHPAPRFTVLDERRRGGVDTGEEIVRDLERRNAFKKARAFLHIRQELGHFFMSARL